jgi:tripartite-type tricarboxylate transporter receptor subunit TctC
MKKLFLIISLLLNLCIAQAQVPNNFSVVVSQAPGGTYDLMCRKLFEIYDKTYNANTVVVNRLGGYGSIAQREVVRNTKFSAGCTAASEFWVNPYLYPMPDADKIRVVTIIARQTDFFYTGIKNPARSFSELIDNAIKTNKTVTIGGWPAHIAKLEYIMQHHGVKYSVINYQKLSDMIPSLIDGTLDIGAEGGTLMSFVKEDKIKFIGYINDTDWSKLPAKNYLKQYPDLAQWSGSFVMYVSKSTSDDIFNEYTQKITKIIKSDEFVEWTISRELTPVGNSPKQAEDFLEKARLFYYKFRTK